MKRRCHPGFRGGLFLLLSLAMSGALVAGPGHDFSLTDCLRIAIDHNPQLRIASEQFLTARGQAIKLHAILYPTAYAQGLTAPATLYVQINQIFYSRATFPQLRISHLAQDQAVINYRQTLDDIVFQVRQAFANALGARQSDELVRELISSQVGAVGTAQQLFQAGRSERSELLGVQVSRDRFAQQQVTSQLTATQAFLLLDTLLGEDLPADSRLVGNLDESIPADLNPENLIAEALRDRADLKLLQSLRLTQQEQILVDLKNALPVLGASSNSAFSPPAVGPISNFDLERNYDEPEIQRQEGNSQLPLSLYFTWVVFDGGAMAGLGATDRAHLESQDEAIDALKRSIPGEVTAAVEAVRTERDILRSFDAVTPLKEIHHSAELDYEAGRIRQLDLINLEGDGLGEEQLRLASEVRLSLALAALDHAMGHGLLTEPTNTPSLPP